MNGITKNPATFRARDGSEHPTWNAARKHMTGLDLLDCIQGAAPAIEATVAVRIRDALLSEWNVSKRAHVRALLEE